MCTRRITCIVSRALREPVAPRSIALVRCTDAQLYAPTYQPHGPATARHRRRGIRAHADHSGRSCSRIVGSERHPGSGGGASPHPRSRSPAGNTARSLHRQPFAWGPRRFALSQRAGARGDCEPARGNHRGRRRGARISRRHGSGSGCRGSPKAGLGGGHGEHVVCTSGCVDAGVLAWHPVDVLARRAAELAPRGGTRRAAVERNRRAADGETRGPSRFVTSPGASCHDARLVQRGGDEPSGTRLDARDSQPGFRAHGHG